MAQRTRSQFAALAAGGLAAAALSGCTTSDDPPAADAESSSERQIESFATLADGWQGVVRDVTVADCPTGAGDVTASGTAVNSAGEPRDLLILVSWLAPQTTDPLLQLQQTLPDVPAGEQRQWTLSGTLLADAGSCIVGARSGSLPSS